MDSSNDLNHLLEYLRKAFPSLKERRDLAHLSHQDWVKSRMNLQLLVANDVVAELPFVLVDLAQTVATSRFENGDMVIYFLDVLAGPVDLDDPARRALIEKFAEEEIGGEAGERFKHVMMSKLPEVGNPSEEERRARDRRDRESSFTELTSQQQESVYRWLRYINTFDQQEQHEAELLWAKSPKNSFVKPLQFEHCRNELLRASAYWYQRSHSAGVAQAN